MAERSGSAVKGNGFDPKLTSLFVKDIERLTDEIDSKKGEYMAWVQRQREMINDIYERAKDAGIPKKDLKDVIKIRALQEKIDAILDNEDAERAETIEQLRFALGDLADTPLGQAAENVVNMKDKAKKGGKDGKPKGMPGADSPGSIN